MRRAWLEQASSSWYGPPGTRAPSIQTLLIQHVVTLHRSMRALMQRDCFDAGVQFARAEGILPAPEANHAVRGAIDEAIRCREEGTSRAILFNLCGHGHFDMQAYDDYLNGRLPEVEFEDAQVEEAMASLPEVPVPG